MRMQLGFSELEFGLDNALPIQTGWESPSAVGIWNNNKRKESTRVREVCNNCQFFFG